MSDEWKPELMWTRNEHGTYVSECGRFEISYDRTRPVKRGRWTLYDWYTEDVMHPGYRRCDHAWTLTTCKSKANRWMRGSKY